ncbi:hypothetical protein N9143_00270 [bacterium]|nr:hypothetical protein [bacterium]MDB4562689.1 hypothetical protein [Akkermansiaceae bacterium]
MKYLLLSTLALASLHAGEHTLKETLFEKTLSLDATFIPSEATVLKIDPQQWSSYVILELTDHGSSVKKGDVLLSCDPEDFQKHLAETKKGVAGRKIALARAERELADLEISTPHELESQRLKVERAQESLDYFKKTGRALEVETTKERLESSKRSLSYYEEELKQLLKMYGEDQVTEETEEIILKRQRTAVKSAKFALKKNQLSTAWALEKTIPQKALDLERKFEASSRAFETAKLNLPRVLEEKRLSVAKAKRDDVIADEKLAELEKDSAFFTITAPTDGTVYYGEVADGAWSAGSTAKFLMLNGSLPKKAALMSLVPATSPLALYGTVNQEQRLALKVENKATVTVSGLSDQEFAAKLTKLALVPNAAGVYETSFSAELPADSPIVGAMKAKVEVTTYRNEKALTVPSAAITEKDGKSTVEVKLADGKNESREITTGKTSDGSTEILSGLTIDQVVLVPEP